VTGMCDGLETGCDGLCQHNPLKLLACVKVTGFWLQTL
jgi:hypothetical protein